MLVLKFQFALLKQRDKTFKITTSSPDCKRVLLCNTRDHIKLF